MHEVEMNTFNENEFIEISNKFKNKPIIKNIEIKCSKIGYLQKMKKLVKNDRRGEVVFCVRRPNGKYILITCEEYPKGIFRIPTGGINYDENIIEAVLRETKEELGLDVDIEDFIGVLKIKFSFENDSEMFYSYIFVLNEVGGRLLEDASDDEVSEIKEAELNDFEEVLLKLININKKWIDWGRFRYETSKAVYSYLMDRRKEKI
ncbi:MAG: NUDIX hydrolase [Bacillota bacterium]|nr:NUDIX hydrolase [Bacillota bacterium]